MQKSISTSKFLLLPFIYTIILVSFIPLIKIVVSSFTSDNVLESPYFIGFNNYIHIFTQDNIFKIALKNSAINAILISIIVGTISYVISSINKKLPFGIKIIILLLINLNSLFILGGGLHLFFSSDAYGSLNCFLLQNKIIYQPLNFAIKYPKVLQLLTYCLIITGPVCTVLSFINLNPKPNSLMLKILFPIKNSILIYITGILPVVLIPICNYAITLILGNPSNNYIAQTLLDHLFDYGIVRLEVGYACAISVVTILCILIYTILFILLSCIIMNIIKYYSVSHNKKNEFKTSIKTKNKIIILITAIFIIIISLILLFPLYDLFFNSLKLPDESYLFPKTFFPSRSSFNNYSTLFSLTIENIKFSKCITNMILIPLLPSIVLSVVSALAALGLINLKDKVQNTVILIFASCFILLPITSFPLQNIYNSIINNTLKLGFFATFFSASPILALLYNRKILSNSIKYKRNIIHDLLLASIPVILINYVICFINSYVGFLSYNKCSFTIYISSILKNSISSNVYNAWFIIVTLIAFTFLIAGLIIGYKIYINQNENNSY